MKKLNEKKNRYTSYILECKNEISELFCNDITEILLKVELNNITLTHIIQCKISEF
jgi:hypothetical protein